MRPDVRAANENARLRPTETQLEAQLLLYQTEQLRKLFDAMAEVGGPEVIEFCFSVAEDAAEPRQRRLDALAVLERVIGPQEQLLVARRQAATLAVPEPAPEIAGQTRNAAGVVASLAKDFRRCYSAELKQNPNAGNISGRVTSKIDAAGNVASLSSTGSMSPSLTQCVEGVVRTARFEPPTGGGATVVIPIAFEPK